MKEESEKKKLDSEGATEDETSDDCEEIPSVTPMEPLQGAQHYNYVRGLTEFLHMTNPQQNSTSSHSKIGLCY